MSGMRIHVSMAALAATFACSSSPAETSDGGTPRDDAYVGTGGGYGTGGAGGSGETGGVGETGGYGAAGGGGSGGGGGGSSDGGLPSDAQIPLDATIECLPDSELNFRTSGPFAIDVTNAIMNPCSGTADANSHVEISFTAPVPSTDLLALVVVSIDALPKGQTGTGKPIDFTMLLAGETGDIWESTQCTIDVGTNADADGDAGAAGAPHRYRIAAAVHCAADIPGQRSPTPPLKIERLDFVTAIVY
jgi:hypothetical protein